MVGKQFAGRINKDGSRTVWEIVRPCTMEDSKGNKVNMFEVKPVKVEDKN